jgi:hypothetical protein
MRRYYFDLLANTVAPSSNREMECSYMQPSRKKLSAHSPLWPGMQSARECSTNQMSIQVRDGGGRSCKSGLQLRLRCPAYFRRAPHRHWRRIASQTSRIPGVGWLVCGFRASFRSFVRRASRFAISQSAPDV